MARTGVDPVTPRFWGRVVLQALSTLGRQMHGNEKYSKYVVARTGVDPVTPRFSGVCSAD